MLISIIVAMAENRVIGRDGQLPWRLPGDLQRFKRLTMGATLLMGRQTFESIGRALPGRRTIVLSRRPALQAEGCEVAGSIPESLRLAEPADELFICGGSEVFRQTITRADRIYLTQIEGEFEGDRYFPELPAGVFQTLFSKRYTEELNYTFSLLQRHGGPASIPREVQDKL